MEESTASKKLVRAKKEQRKSKEKEDIGIPTIFTPVPSREHSVIAQQHRRFHEPIASQKLTFESHSSAESISKATPIFPTEIKKMDVNEDQYSAFNNRLLTKLALFNVFFMQNMFKSFEVATDRTLLVLLRIVLSGISDEISNKFSFYAFASPYDVNWKRQRGELMKKPPAENIFRQLLTPSQKDITLEELFHYTKNEGMESINIYIFIKNMEDTYSPDGLSHKCWKYQQVVN